MPRLLCRDYSNLKVESLTGVLNLVWKMTYTHNCITRQCKTGTNLMTLRIRGGGGTTSDGVATGPSVSSSEEQ